MKLAFSAVLCAVLCFLFPVASPLFFSLFLGVAVRESGMKHIYDFVSGPLLYGSTFMLGVLLGVLCDAHLLLDPKILKLLVLGIVDFYFPVSEGLSEDTSCTLSNGEITIR